LGNAGWITGEANITTAIKEGGPVTSIIRLADGFFDKKKTTFRLSDADKEAWKKEDACADKPDCKGPRPGFHVVQVVGWEEDKTGKYWIIQNSWGANLPSWVAANGARINNWPTGNRAKNTYETNAGPFLRVVRGNDELGLESNPTFLADIKVWVGSGNEAKKVPISRASWIDEYGRCKNGYDKEKLRCYSSTDSEKDRLAEHRRKERMRHAAQLKAKSVAKK
jgi:hypothetical protein